MHSCPRLRRFALLATLVVPLVALATLGAAAPRPKTPPVPVVAPNATLRGLDGQPLSLRPQGATKATVLLFLSTQCPISNRYTPRIAKWTASLDSKRVRVLGVYSNARETDAAVAAYAKERHLAFPMARDTGGTLARTVGASLTPEAVVLDTTGRVRYRGRIDDNDDPARVTKRDLAAAVAALLAGKSIPVAQTRAFGCVIQGTAIPEPAPATPDTSSTSAPTYARDVAPILQHRCVECHTRGEVAPFALGTYAEAAQWAKQIQIETRRRAMPPWKADSHGEFLGERRLTDDEITTLSAWVDAGAPAGSQSLTPPLPQRREPGTRLRVAQGGEGSPSPWKLGTPDAVFEMSMAYTVPTEGKDVYRCFVLPTNFDNDKWVSSIEFQPGNRGIVHHINVWIDTSGKGRELDAKDPAPGYMSPTPGNTPGIVPFAVLGGWAPGHTPWQLPAGVGNLLPKGADLVLEVHYVITGKPEEDRSRFGLRFVNGPIQKRLQLGEVSADRIRIPAGEKSFRVSATRVATDDVTLLSLTPHMHLLGRTMTLTAHFPNGTERQLVSLPSWDFHWQLSYRFREPVKLPRGTRLDLVATYDNSADNPNNPNTPPRDVHGGESTRDEMCNCFLAFTFDAEDRTKPAEDAPPVVVP